MAGSWFFAHGMDLCPDHIMGLGWHAVRARQPVQIGPV